MGCLEGCIEGHIEGCEDGSTIAARDVYASGRRCNMTISAITLIETFKNRMSIILTTTFYLFTIIGRLNIII